MGAIDLLFYLGVGNLFAAGIFLIGYKIGKHTEKAEYQKREEEYQKKLNLERQEASDLMKEKSWLAEGLTTLSIGYENKGV